MQAIVLAAGQSSRFIPFNSAHKSTISLLGKPVILHTLESLKKTGVTDVIIISSAQSIIPSLIDENLLGLHITHLTQPEPLGMGNAILLAEPHLQDSFFVLNASHVDFHEFAADLQAKKDATTDTVLLAKEEKNVQEYGILRVEGDVVKDIVEKPQPGTEPSNLRVIGIYLLSKGFIATLKETSSDHYQLETAIASQTKKGTVKFVKTEKEVLTLKYAWDLFGIKDYLLKQITPSIAPTANVSPHAIIDGNVVIEEEATVLEGACIKGPAYIGKGAFVGSNALVRNGSIIEKNAVVGSYMECKNTILMEGATTHTGVIEDSIIGKNCKIAAGILTANVRLDRGEIFSIVKEQKVNSQRKAFGVMMGNDVQTGVGITTMPGVSIGEGSIIGPSTTIMKNIPPKTKYYTKFSDVVEEKME